MNAAELASIELEIKHLSDADQAFGRTGIPNFVLEEVLAELQVTRPGGAGCLRPTFAPAPRLTLHMREAAEFALTPSTPGPLRRVWAAATWTG